MRKEIDITLADGPEPMQDDDAALHPQVGPPAGRLLGIEFRRQSNRRQRSRRADQPRLDGQLAARRDGEPGDRSFARGGGRSPGRSRRSSAAATPWPPPIMATSIPTSILTLTTDFKTASSRPFISRGRRGRRRRVGEHRRLGLGIEPGAGLSGARALGRWPAGGGDWPFAPGQDRAVGRRDRPRFALVISNDSGCGGAALSKRNFGETLLRSTPTFRTGFATTSALQRKRSCFALRSARAVGPDRSATFVRGQRARGPVGRPQRRVSGGHACRSGLSTLGDRWSGRLGSAREMPAPEQPLQAGTIGYHLRTGKHGITPYDWQQYLNFADRRWKSGKN